VAGGITDTSVASAATASLYACFATCSLLAPLMANTVGPRLTLFAGTIGYVVYVLSLLLYSQGAAPGGLVIGAGALNGVCAGLLWTAQGMLMLSYPTPELKGSFVAIFWVIFNTGAVLGGLLSMAPNFHGTAPTASPATFTVYMCVMCAGALLSLMLQPLDRVVRPDGSRVAHTPATEVIDEVRGMWQQLTDRRLLALYPLFLYSNWFYAYQFDCFNAPLFDARTQGLNNALCAPAQPKHGTPPCPPAQRPGPLAALP